MSAKITRTNAILAFCHQCMGYYHDGRHSCTSVNCPLYTWMPYRDSEPDLEWANYNPRRAGKVLWEDSKREIDDATRQALVERMEKARAARGQTSDDDLVEDSDDES